MCGIVMGPRYTPDRESPIGSGGALAGEGTFRMILMGHGSTVDHASHCHCEQRYARSRAVTWGMTIGDGRKKCHSPACGRTGERSEESRGVARAADEGAPGASGFLVASLLGMTGLAVVHWEEAGGRPCPASERRERVGEAVFPSLGGLLRHLACGSVPRSDSPFDGAFRALSRDGKAATGAGRENGG